MIVVVIASLVLTAIVFYRQRIRLTALQSAAAGYENAKHTRKVAVKALLQYMEFIFKQDPDHLKGEDALALSDLKRAPDSSASDEKAKLRVERAEDRLATLDLTTLVKYTKSKTLKAFYAEVEKARSNELARKATLEQLKAAFARQWW